MTLKGKKKAYENKANRLKTAYRKAAEPETVMETLQTDAKKLLSDIEWEGKTATEFEELVESLKTQLVNNDNGINTIRDKWNKDASTAENKASECKDLIDEIWTKTTNFIATPIENLFN